MVLLDPFVNVSVYCKSVIDSDMYIVWCMAGSTSERLHYALYLIAMVFYNTVREPDIHKGLLTVLGALYFISVHFFFFHGLYFCLFMSDLPIR